MDKTFENILKFIEIILSAGAFYMAYAAFVMQSETFKSQLEVTKLENQKFLYSIRPIFEKSYLSVTGQESIININIMYNLRLTQNIARDFEIINRVAFMNDQVTNFCFSYVSVTQEVTIYQGVFLKRDLPRFIDIEIHFADEIGNDYCQFITGTISSPQISPAWPHKRG
jgi:hypothetical protein